MQDPKILSLSRHPIDPGDYKYRRAMETDYSTLIDAPTIVVDSATGRPSIVYLELDDDCAELVAVLRAIKFHKEPRTDGMWSQSRTIGYNPRVALRRDFCTATSLAAEDAAAHAVITSYAVRVAQYYQRYNPDLFGTHQQMIERVLPDWRLEDSVFTSGIINKNNPLLFHFDTGNFKDVWSNMLVFKNGCTGGYLAVPEYGLGFTLKNNSLLMFDGQNLLHGVTPFRLKRGGHRFSIVFYSLQQMWQCLPPGEELDRIRKLRTEREDKRLERERAGEPLKSKKRNTRPWVTRKAAEVQVEDGKGADHDLADLHSQ